MYVQAKHNKKICFSIILFCYLISVLPTTMDGNFAGNNTTTESRLSGPSTPLTPCLESRFPIPQSPQTPGNVPTTSSSNSGRIYINDFLLIQQISDFVLNLSCNS